MASKVLDKDYSKEEIKDLSITVLEELAKRLDWSGYPHYQHRNAKTHPNYYRNTPLKSRKEYLVARLQASPKARLSKTTIANQKKEKLAKKKRQEAEARKALNSVERVKIVYDPIIKLIEYKLKPCVFDIRIIDNDEIILQRNPQNRKSINRGPCNEELYGSKKQFITLMEGLIGIIDQKLTDAITKLEKEGINIDYLRINTGQFDTVDLSKRNGKFYIEDEMDFGGYSFYVDNRDDEKIKVSVDGHRLEFKIEDLKEVIKLNQ